MGFGGENRDLWYWNYAANKDDGSNKTCPTADLDCYFLPHHNCGTLDEIKTGSTGVETIESQNIPPGSNINDGDKAMNAYLFITRKQLWLRRAMYDLKQRFKARVGPESDCTIIHVRRGDIVLDSSTRRYFPVKAYIDLIPKDKLKVSLSCLLCSSLFLSTLTSLKMLHERAQTIVHKFNPLMNYKRQKRIPTTRYSC